MCTNSVGWRCVCQNGCNGFGWNHPVLCCQPDDMSAPAYRDMTIRDLATLPSDGGASD